ncbi:coil containing protein [Vibrio phage 1.121.O._10N.286.46.C4]|nr:coil containing protein [Vibrio phage 1.121.O._10N.286.46.C4]
MTTSRIEKFAVRNGELLDEIGCEIFDVTFEEVTGQIYKSANSKTSEFYIHLTTISSIDKYNTYILSLNELEASFDTATNDIETITLRDTSVNKKLAFTTTKGTLVYAKGQDTVGKNSEYNNLVSKEAVHSMSVNDVEYIAPIDLEELYLGLTGYDLSKRPVGEEEEAEAVSYNWWTMKG